MKRLLLLGLAAALAYAAKAPLYVFEDGVGARSLSIEQETELAKKTGYAGIFYDGANDIPERLAAHKARGLKALGIYIVMNLSDAKLSYDAGLPEAIRQLKGSGALISFAVNGKAASGDDLVVPVVREVADMAAQSGLKVVLYPHYGMYMARIEDALRLREKAGRRNVGIAFNLCHWLRSGDEANMAARLKEALPYTLLVSINGADHEGDWDRLIQPLDRGSFDVRGFVKAVKSMGYKGPIGLQCYNIKGDREENLKRSMAAWRSF
ncbi:MAG: TIM barrel protein [Bryobacteraceae bacterium]|jgi:sugar phosphate isomerase/epimerase